MMSSKLSSFLTALALSSTALAVAVPQDAKPNTSIVSPFPITPYLPICTGGTRIATSTATVTAPCGGTTAQCTQSYITVTTHITETIHLPPTLCDQLEKRAIPTPPKSRCKPSSTTRSTLTTKPPPLPTYPLCPHYCATTIGTGLPKPCPYIRCPETATTPPVHTEYCDWCPTIHCKKINTYATEVGCESTAVGCWSLPQETVGCGYDEQPEGYSITVG